MASVLAGAAALDAALPKALCPKALPPVAPPDAGTADWPKADWPNAGVDAVADGLEPKALEVVAPKGLTGVED